MSHRTVRSMVKGLSAGVSEVAIDREGGVRKYLPWALGGERDTNTNTDTDTETPYHSKKRKELSISVHAKQSKASGSDAVGPSLATSECTYVSRRLATTDTLEDRKYCTFRPQLESVIKQSLWLKFAPPLSKFFPRSSFMATPERILVTGGTGKQGRATILALLAFQQETTIIAVARSPNSASAQSLAALHNVEVIQGTLDYAAAIFRKAGPVTGVFCVLPVGRNEEQQGKNMIDCALKNGVKHFVYASVDRGGSRSSDTPTPILHFASKHSIEKYLETHTAGTDMTYTIIRPAALFENLSNDFSGKMFAAVWSTMPKHTKLQFIATEDLGHYAALALLNPAQYHNSTMSLAGDSLTFDEAQAIFQAQMGSSLPVTFQALGSFARWAVPDLGRMIKWFEEEGYAADIQALRRGYPELKDFAAWLKQSSGFVEG
ncbi:hypothetical protein BKA64DRAFT_728739 [Cadophora sp. MPI-SDFR-AT-0126]|nr:hypothetical protein BKA64DRAFT_728739 [Leotiomycetes sp. MPI-SDFR-AT-0126]